MTRDSLLSKLPPFKSKDTHKNESQNFFPTVAGSMLILLCLLLFSASMYAFRGGEEFTGQFESELIPNKEDFEKVIFRYSTPDRVKGLSVPADAHLAVGKLVDPQTDENTILALLVEEEDADPVIYVDTNGDSTLSPDEKYLLKPSEKDNPYLWEATAKLNLKNAPFKTFPLVLTYFKTVRMGKMGPDDRMVTESTVAMARGRVDVRGKKVLVQYGYIISKKNVDPQVGDLGADTDENGEIDMDNLSPESTKADNETVVFRVGNLYISTKKADVAKNQIVLREQEAKDYKRLELNLGKDFPDFGFTDFDGKKRKFSEFHGKYVLLDIWGLWCPACRDELPYIRESYHRFQNRNLTVIGLNTDADFTIESIKKAMAQNGMTWTQAQLTSIVDFIGHGLRISSFPTTFLISPEGRILSMSRSHRDEKSLRGEDLLETLDDVLPKQ